MQLSCRKYQSFEAKILMDFKVIFSENKRQIFKPIFEISVISWSIRNNCQVYLIR